MPPSPSLSNFTLANWNPLQHNPHIFFISFSILSYPIRPQATTDRYWIYQTICKAKLIKVIINLYTDHNSLWTKNTTHQKTGSLRATSLSKLDNMVNSNSSSIQSMLNSLQNGKCSFIFTTLLEHTTNDVISTINRSSTSVNFHLPIPPLLVQKIILKIPTNIPFLSSSAVFHLPLFEYSHSNSLHQKYFPYLNHFANLGCFKGLGS